MVAEIKKALVAFQNCESKQAAPCRTATIDGRSAGSPSLMERLVIAGPENGRQVAEKAIAFFIFLAIGVAISMPAFDYEITEEQTEENVAMNYGLAICLITVLVAVGPNSTKVRRCKHKEVTVNV